MLLRQMVMWVVISDNGEALLWLPLQMTSDGTQTPYTTGQDANPEYATGRSSWKGCSSWTSCPGARID